MYKSGIKVWYIFSVLFFLDRGNDGRLQLKESTTKVDFRIQMVI